MLAPIIINLVLSFYLHRLGSIKNNFLLLCEFTFLVWYSAIYYYRVDRFFVPPPILPDSNMEDYMIHLLHIRDVEAALYNWFPLAFATLAAVYLILTMPSFRKQKKIAIFCLLLEIPLLLYFVAYIFAKPSLINFSMFLTYFGRSIIIPFLTVYHTTHLISQAIKKRREISA
ncbi:MAG: hypothetical protein LBI70_02080 [Rickettsiales bacterium]|nr:hypothetical protein [Rickettsiales bacterium]